MKAPELVTGTLKQFDANRGFGFVEFPDLPDALLPIPPLREAHVERMRLGAPMKCEIIKTEKGPRVTKVLWIDNSQSDKPLIEVWYRRIGDMSTGFEPARVKWYNPERGFAFLTRGVGTADIFVHHQTLKRGRIDQLKYDDPVLVRYGTSPSGLVAVEVAANPP